MKQHHKTVLITGGSGRIAKSLIHSLLERNHKIIYTYRNTDPFLGKTAFCTGIKASFDTLDSIENFCKKIRSLDEDIDILVNNAGTSISTLFIQHDYHDVNNVFTPNLLAPTLISQCLIQKSIERGTPLRIVSLGSLVQHGAPSNSSYALTKGGLLGLAKGIHDVYQNQQIYSFLAAVGYVESKMTEDLPAFAKQQLVDSCPLKRAGSPDEISNALIFLTSGKADYLSGKSFYVSGGLHEIPF